MAEMQYDVLSIEDVVRLFDLNRISSDYKPTEEDFENMTNVVLNDYPSPIVVIEKSLPLEWKILKGEKFLCLLNLLYKENAWIQNVTNFRVHIKYIKSKNSEDTLDKIFYALNLD